MPILSQWLVLNPLKDAAKVDAIDYRADFENLFTRLDSMEKFIHTGKTKNDLIRYIPGITKPAYQGQLEGCLTKKVYPDNTYKGHKVAEFNVKLTNNQYMNFLNVQLVFPMKIKKSTNNNTNLDATLMTVNNFFVHWSNNTVTKFQFCHW